MCIITVLFKNESANQRRLTQYHSHLQNHVVIIAVAAALQYQTCDVTFQARRTGRVLKFPLLSTLSYKKLLYLLLHLLSYSVSN